MVVGGEVVIVVVLVAEVVDAGVVGDMVVVVVVIVVVLLILLLFLKPWCCCQCWSAKACLRLLDHGFFAFLLFCFCCVDLDLFLSKIGKRGAELFVAAAAGAYLFVSLSREDCALFCLDLSLYGGVFEAGLGADDRSLMSLLVGWCARHVCLFCASAVSCSKVATCTGTSCSILDLSPLSNWTRIASLVSRSPGARRMCPSHFHLRALIAVMMS